jgi:hypothetical protein
MGATWFVPAGFGVVRVSDIAAVGMNVDGAEVCGHANYRA